MLAEERDFMLRSVGPEEVGGTMEREEEGEEEWKEEKRKDGRKEKKEQKE